MLYLYHYCALCAAVQNLLVEIIKGLADACSMYVEGTEMKWSTFYVLPWHCL